MILQLSRQQRYFFVPNQKHLRPKNVRAYQVIPETPETISCKFNIHKIGQLF